MILNEYVQNRQFSYNTETKTLTVDAMSEYSFDIDVNSIRTLMNMFKLLDENGMLQL